MNTEPDRKTIKKAIRSESEGDRELDAATLDAQKLKLAILKQKNDFELQKASQEMGWLGRIWGNERNAPFTIAFMLMLMVLVLVACILIAAYFSDEPQLWFANIQHLVALAGTLFGFLAGTVTTRRG